MLYHFVDATRLTAEKFGLKGTMLAPHAHVTFKAGTWSGGVYAVSLNKTGVVIVNTLLDELAGADRGDRAYCEGTCVAKKELGAACGMRRRQPMRQQERCQTIRRRRGAGNILETAPQAARCPCSLP